MVSLAVELPRSVIAPDEVRRVVDDVLGRPEYAELAPSLGARVRGWVVEQLGRLLEVLVGSSQASLVGSLLLVLALAAAGVLAVRFARAVRGDPSAMVVTADGLGRDPADWTAEADAHEQAGRDREALRCRYRALIAVLAAAEVVGEAPGRTTGEYLDEARDHRPEVAADVAAVTAAFEAVWYGHDEVDAATTADVRSRLAAVRRTVAGRRPEQPAMAGDAG